DGHLHAGRGPARVAIPLQPQSSERGHVTGEVPGHRCRQPRAIPRPLPDPGADEACQRILSLEGGGVMLSTPFLTQLDSRAAIKGSRDPLGVQSIWSRLGRHVVGNLTTVSNSVPDFMVLLLGYYFAERVADNGGSEGDLATFLKWEQLAAYARAHVNKERSFRGTERVARRLADGERIHLGIDSGAPILGNQKIYGLWGLYTVPGKASGLLEGDPTRLTIDAREFVESSLLPVLEANGGRIVRGIVERLGASAYLIDVRDGSKDAAVLEGIARLLRNVRRPDRDLYREHLLYGGPSDQEP